MQENYNSFVCLLSSIGNKFLKLQKYTIRNNIIQISKSDQGLVIVFALLTDMTDAITSMHVRCNSVVSLKVVFMIQNIIFEKLWLKSFYGGI